MDAGSQSPESAVASHPVSRRAVLVGSTVAVLAGAGAGIAAGVLRHLPGTAGQPAPPELISAASAEQNLLSAVQATLKALPRDAPTPVRAALTTTAADHVAHLTALRAALAGYRQPTAAGGSVISGTAEPAGSAGTATASPPVSSGQPSAGAPATPDAVRGAEERASSAAAARAAQLTGRDATLLASIAACEATHATWLSTVLA